MPFLEENILGERSVGSLPTQSGAEPEFGDVVRANIRYNTTLGSFAKQMTDITLNNFEPDPFYDSTEDMAGYEAYADDLIHAESREEMASMKSRIDRDLQDRETVSNAAGLSGFMAMMAGEIVDPINMVTFGSGATAYRMGESILKGAARTAAVAGAAETGREAYLQSQQSIRTAEESFTNIAATTLLTGVLGGGAAYLSPARKLELAAKIEEDMTIGYSENMGQSVGAAKVGTTPEQEKVMGLEKTQKVLKYVPEFLKSPVYRTATSEAPEVRKIGEALADTSTIKNKNQDFIPSETSVENAVKDYDRFKYHFYKEYTPLYSQYRKRMSDLKKKHGAIPEEERLGSRRDGSMTVREFDDAIGRAGRRNDKSPIAEVQRAAELWRKYITEPLGQIMVDTKLLKEIPENVKTALSYVHRLYNRDKIMADREGFAAKNRQWLRGEQSRAEAQLTRLTQQMDKAATKAEREALQKQIDEITPYADLDDNDIEMLTNQIIDRILGLPNGRLPYDLEMELPVKFVDQKQAAGAPRGAAKARVYNIPDELIEDYLINDVHSIIESQLRTTAPDAELMRVFGTLDVDVLHQRIQEDYMDLLRRAKDDPKKTRQLEKAKRSDMKDIQAMFEQIRGVYAQPDDYAAPQHVLRRAAMSWNFTRLLGGMTLSAAPDMGRTVMVHGMERTMRDGIQAMANDFKTWNVAVEDLREAAIGLDMTLSTTALARANMDEFMPTSGKIDAISAGMAGGFQVGGVRVPSFGNLTLMNQWNTMQKTFAGIITQTRMMRGIDDFSKGKDIGVKEIQNLASHGIGKEMAERIGKQFKKHGYKKENIYVPNAKKWDDAEAQRIFRAAVRKQVDEIIVTPGLDRPLWMGTAMGKVLGQFKSFQFASMQRVLLPALQQADAATLNGTIMMIGMGSLVYAMKTKLAGNEVSDDPRVWITEGVDRSGITGWVFDVNNIIEKATRGRVGVNALVGGPPMSRYASRNVAASLAGPSFGLLEDIPQITGAIATGEWTKSDTRAVRRLMPYQNLIYFRGLFDKAEESINKDIGTK